MIDETRPSEEMTGKVVAKWNGEGAYLRHSQAPVRSQTELLNGDVLTVFDNTGRTIPCDDPRDDLDAAMELLGHLGDNYGDVSRSGHAWEFESWDYLSETGGKHSRPCTLLRNLPTSGPGLRYGIVRIAAEVMGVRG